VEKNLIMALCISCIVTLIMLGLTRVQAYIDAMNNWLFMMMLLFFMVAIFGYGANALFYKKSGGK